MKFIEGFGTGNMHIFFFRGVGQVLYSRQNFLAGTLEFAGKDEIKWTARLETCRLANKHGNQQSTILSRMTRTHVYV